MHISLSAQYHWFLVWSMLVFAFLLIFLHRSHSARRGSRLDLEIANATLGFGKIVSINLASRTDHRDALTAAAAVTNLHIEFVNGVRGDQVPDKALLADSDRKRLGPGNIGSWRAHMDTIQDIVAQNLSTALILEDDVDWDVRIREQLQAFALGVRALTQPLPSAEFADPTFASRDSIAGVLPPGHDFSSLDPPVTVPPTVSPYGDNWDVLWLGHCGVKFAKPKQHIPKARYVIQDDVTVTSFANRQNLQDAVRTKYSDHTRIIHHAMGPICTFAYAVSQRGAVKILQELGVDSFNGPFDNIMASFCDRHTCITSQPQYFSHWRAAGPIAKDSNINNGGKGKFRKHGFSHNIRWSTRLNMNRLLKGVDKMQDQHPD